MEHIGQTDGVVAEIGLFDMQASDSITPEWQLPSDRSTTMALNLFALGCLTLLHHQVGQFEGHFSRIGTCSPGR